MERKCWMMGLWCLWRRVCRVECKACNIDSHFCVFRFLLVLLMIMIFGIWFRYVKFFKVFGCSAGIRSVDFIRWLWIIIIESLLWTLSHSGRWYFRRTIIGSLDSNPMLIYKHMPSEWSYDFDSQFMCMSWCLFYVVFVVIRFLFSIRFNRSEIIHGL